VTLFERSFQINEKESEFIATERKAIKEARKSTTVTRRETCYTLCAQSYSPTAIERSIKLCVIATRNA
jgi:hypothetical protein